MHAHFLDDNDHTKEFVETHRKKDCYAALVTFDSFGCRVTDREFSRKDYAVFIQSTVMDQVGNLRQAETVLAFTRITSSFVEKIMDVCMDFYLKGLYDYTEYGLTNPDAFLKKHYRMLGNEHKYKCKPETMVMFAQRFCFERKLMEEPFSTAARQYETLSANLYNILRNEKNANDAKKWLFYENKRRSSED
jgi:hypothetical protein